MNENTKGAKGQKPQLQTVSLRLPEYYCEETKRLADVYGISQQDLLRTIFGLGYPVIHAASGYADSGNAIPFGGIYPDADAPSGMTGTVAETAVLYGGQAALLSQVVEPALRWLGVSSMSGQSDFEIMTRGAAELLIQKLQRHLKLLAEEMDLLASCGMEDEFAPTLKKAPRPVRRIGDQQPQREKGKGQPGE